MNQLTKVFEGNEIRIIGKEKAPFFMVKDVCAALSLSNPSMVANRVRDKYKANFSLGLSGSAPVFVSEAGLYQIIMRADQNEVTERFQDWVYEEVLPSIRKDGGYIVAQPDESPEVIMARGLIAAQSTIERMKAEQQIAVATIEEQKPKVAFAEIVERSSDSILVREFAKVVSKRGFVIGEKKLFKRLRHCKYLDKKNMPYQRYVDQGVFEVMERPVSNPNSTTIRFTTRITGKGQIYLYNKLLTGELHDEL